MASSNTRPDADDQHHYHAEASALHGHLDLPLNAPVKPQAYVKVAEKSGYLSERASDFRLEGIVSFRSAYTQASGHAETKPGHGPVTLATSVVEGFNVLDIVTADRIVAQIMTEHPPKRYVPNVTFLGTRFVNLQSAGHRIDVDLDTEIFGGKADEEVPHSRGKFGNDAAQQREKLLGMSELPSEVRDRYNQSPSDSASRRPIECSLVQQVNGSCPGRQFGHVIDIPHFGKVYLAVVRLTEWIPDPPPKLQAPRTQVELTMIYIKMGCATSGNLSGGNSIVNGGTKGTG